MKCSFFTQLPVFIPVRLGCILHQSTMSSLEKSSDSAWCLYIPSSLFLSNFPNCLYLSLRNRPLSKKCLNLLYLFWKNELKMKLQITIIIYLSQQEALFPRYCFIHNEF